MSLQHKPIILGKWVPPSQISANPNFYQKKSKGRKKKKKRIMASQLDLVWLIRSPFKLASLWRKTSFSRFFFFFLLLLYFFSLSLGFIISLCCFSLLGIIWIFKIRFIFAGFPLNFVWVFEIFIWDFSEVGVGYPILVRVLGLEPRMPQDLSSEQDPDDSDIEFVQVDPTGRYGRVSLIFYFIQNFIFLIYAAIF